MKDFKFFSSQALVRPVIFRDSAIFLCLPKISFLEFIPNSKGYSSSFSFYSPNKFKIPTGIYLKREGR